MNMAKLTKEQILTQEINQKYLNDIEETISIAEQMIIKNMKNNNSALLNALRNAMYKIRKFVDCQTNNRSQYQSLKIEADDAKHRIADILANLNLLETRRIGKALDEVKVEQAETKTRLDTVEKKQEKQDERFDKIERERQEDRQAREKEVSEQRTILTQILERDNQQDRKINDNAERITEQTKLINNIHHQLNVLDERLSKEITEIKTDIQKINQKIEHYVEKNKDTIAIRLKNAMEDKNKVPKYTVDEYHKVMEIISLMDNLGVDNGVPIVSIFENQINKALHDTLPKILVDIVEGVLSSKDFKIKTAILSHHDKQSCQELFTTAINSIKTMNPSSELISIVKDAMMLVGHTAILATNIATAKIEKYRTFRGKKKTADEMRDLICQGDKELIEEFNRVITEYHNEIWTSYSIPSFEEWCDTFNFISERKELVQMILYYLASYEKGEFASYKALNGDILEWWQDHRRQARHCLEDQSKTNAEKLFNQMDVASLLRIYAKGDLSPLAEYCYQFLITNILLKENLFIGANKKSKTDHRDKYLEHFEKACLLLSRGVCSRTNFFAVYGNFCLEIKQTTVIDVVANTASATADAITNHNNTVQRTTTIIEIENEKGISQMTVNRAVVSSR